MKNINLFSSHLFVKNVGTEEQKQDLKNQILSAKDNNVGYIPSGNKKCWRSSAKYEMDWLEKEVLVLTRTAIDYYKDIDPDYKKVKDEKITMATWTNVNDPKSKNVVHAHKEFSFVGLYYIDAEGTGDLIFHNPINLLSDCNPKSPFVRTVSYPPKNGNLLLWPAWVPHEVEINNSDRYRINMAFDIFLGEMG